MIKDDLCDRAKIIYDLLMQLSGEGQIFHKITDELGWLSYYFEMNERQIKDLKAKLESHND